MSAKSNFAHAHHAAKTNAAKNAKSVAINAATQLQQQLLVTLAVRRYLPMKKTIANAHRVAVHHHAVAAHHVTLQALAVNK